MASKKGDRDCARPFFPTVFMWVFFREASTPRVVKKSPRRHTLFFFFGAGGCKAQVRSLPGRGGEHQKNGRKEKNKTKTMGPTNRYGVEIRRARRRGTRAGRCMEHAVDCGRASRSRCRCRRRPRRHGNRGRRWCVRARQTRTHGRRKTRHAHT